MEQDFFSAYLETKIPAWKKIGVKHHHGFVIPLFSLHSRSSCGIGDYIDLIPMIHWTKSLKFDVIQLLPLNDTGSDPSPYSSISAFALNPLYLNLDHLPYLEDRELLQLIETLKALDKTKRIQYPEVYKLKDNFLRRYYQLYKNRVITTFDFEKFLKENTWLEGYALFKTIKIAYEWSSWEHWPEAIRNIKPTTYNELLQEFRTEVDYHIFLQFLCFHQMFYVKKIAEEVGVYLMGDIPILLNRESADVWLNPSVFITHLSAGAPPDYFSQNGQNWGFPLYHWENLEKTNYYWWKERLALAQKLYDIYRLDHIVGFFRIWACGVGEDPINGKFIPENKEVWISHGEKILEVFVDSSSMLPIGEDLGVIPPGVRETLKKFGICGTKVIRWERNFETDQKYKNFKHYDPESLTTVSTHDCESIKQWWEIEPTEAQEYCALKGWEYNRSLNQEQLWEILRDSHQTSSLFHINLLSEYLALIPGMTSNDFKEERINIPGTISENNWSYRFIPTVEEIIKNKTLFTMIKSMLE